MGLHRNSLAALTFLMLTACTTAPNVPHSETLTRAEAKTEACPQSILEAGASRSDCKCVEKELYSLGQEPGALRDKQASTQKLFGDETGRRKIAIGVLRLDAFETCGLFDPDHAVAKDL